MQTPSVLLCMGTRPEIIKMAPVYHALQATAIQPIVLHTGQHTDIARPLYEFFGMEPALSLDLSRERPTLGHLSAQLLDALDGVMTSAGASAVLVHGDTSSALAAAMAAFYTGVPVGHVEAGLRSGNGMDPFPEEMNRTLIARLAKWHFAPTQRAVRNLLRESCDPQQVHLVGNTVVDAVKYGLGALLRSAVHSSESGYGGMLPDGLTEWAAGGDLVLVTAHRRENWGPPIEDIASSVAALATKHPHLRFLWPMHPNPAVRTSIAEGLGVLDDSVASRIVLTEPFDYTAMLWALREAWLVMTDSGGIQEEAAALDRPILVLRQTTERPEIIEAGAGKLIGASRTAIESWVDHLIEEPASYQAMQGAENPYGDGHSGEYIAALLESELVALRHELHNAAAQADAMLQTMPGMVAPALGASLGDGMALVPPPSWGPSSIPSAA